MVEILSSGQEEQEAIKYVHTGICVISVLQSFYIFFCFNGCQYSKLYNMKHLKLLKLLLVLCVVYLIGIFATMKMLQAVIGTFLKCALLHSISLGKTGYPKWDKNVYYKIILEEPVNNVLMKVSQNYMEMSDYNSSKTDK